MNDYAMTGMCCYLPNHPVFNNHYESISREDFDFPMSYDFYRSLCQQHGWHDPGSCELPEVKEEIEPKEVIHRHYNYTSDLSRREWDEIEQLKRTVSYLLKEKDKQPIKKKFPTKYLYSSIIEKGDSK